jgi:hypothetical protein
VFTIRPLRLACALACAGALGAAAPAAAPAAGGPTAGQAARALTAELAPYVGQLQARCARRRARRGEGARFDCRWRSARGCRGRHQALRTAAGGWRFTGRVRACRARPSPAPLFGFNDNAVVRDQASAAQDAELNAGLGADVVRVTVDWRWAERHPDDYRLADYDAIYRESLARGIRPIWIPLFAPSWAIDPENACDQWERNCAFPPGPGFEDDYAEFAALLATRYPQSAAIEIWNEPNIKFFWRPSPSPRRYAELLKTSYAAVKRANPAMTVAGGALGDDPDWSNAIPFKPFARALYSFGARGHMDVFSLHPYPHIPGHVDRTLSEARAARAEAGDLATPMWVTETGWSTSGRNSLTWPLEWVLSEREQADHLVALYEKLASQPDIEAVLFHTLIEPTGDPGLSPGPGYGIVRGDLSRKPAYCALARLRALPGGC